MQRFTVFILLFFTALNLSGQSQVTVNGKLVDDKTGGPLEYGTVSFYNAKDSSLVTGGITDFEGTYQLTIAPGTYYLVAQFVSYKSKTVSGIQIPREQQLYTISPITLSQDVETLAEVVVTGKKQEMEMLLDKRVFNVGVDVSNTGRSAAEILDRVPSVAVDQEGNVSLRGSSNVRILIDGKPSGLVGLSDSDGLRLLQGNLVESIEVITNPSARYQAEGQAGIINIILKKERKAGFNGGISLNTGYPNDHGISANLNYRANNFNFFGNYGLNYRRSPGEGYERRRQFDADTTTYLNRDFDFERGGISNNVQFGAEYYFNDKTVLTGSMLIRRSDENNDRNTYYAEFDQNQDLQERSVRTDNEEETEQSREYTLSFRKNFKREKQEFNFDIQYRNNTELEESDLYEETIFSEGLGNTPLIQTSRNDEGERDFLIETFYVHPYAENGILEFGLRSNFRRVGNDYLVQEQNDLGEFDPLYNFSNDFQYDESIQAAYFIVGNTKDRWSWQLGMRGEYTDIQTDLVPLDPNEEEVVNTKNYFNLFPSASLNYKLAGENSLQASYSRRLSRPGFWILNPFSNFSDPRYLRTGNPDLDPVYTDSYEIGYLLNWSTGSLFSSVYYRHSTGEWERITTVDDEGVSTSFPVNLSTEDAVGFELTYSQDLAEWWTINANANIYYSETDGVYSDVRYYAEAFSANGRLNSKFTVWDKFDIQMNYRYRAPRNTTQGSRKSFNTLDIGLSTDMLNGNATLVMNVNDVFNTGVYRGITEGENFYSESEYRRRFRQFTLNFTYRINQKPDRNKKGDRNGDGRSQDMEGDF